MRYEIEQSRFKIKGFRASRLLNITELKTDDCHLLHTRAAMCCFHLMLRAHSCVNVQSSQIHYSRSAELRCQTQKIEDTKGGKNRVIPTFRDVTTFTRRQVRLDQPPG